ncbi:hypothetical protein Tco_0051909 [Tanacetum coccineum]
MVFKNNHDEREHGHPKPSLVCFERVPANRKEIEFEESLRSISKNGSYRIFFGNMLAHKSFTGFKMDVKTAFPACHVYKLKKALYGLKQAPRACRPDIVHATCLCARYQAKPTEKHLKEVKRIFRYLRGTVNTGLWYSKDSGIELTGFSDADYAGCKDTFKSTSGGAQFLAKSWHGPFGLNKIQDVCGFWKILEFLRHWWLDGECYQVEVTLVEERCVVVNVNKQRLVYGEWFKSCVDSRKPEVDRTLGGGDGLERPGGKLSMVVVQQELVSETHFCDERRGVLKVNAVRHNLLLLVNVNAVEGLRDGLGLGLSQRNKAWCALKKYVGPFKVLKKVGAVAYKLELPQELSRVHNTFHVSNLKKCYYDDPLVVPLEGLQVDDKLHFVEAVF